MRIVRLGLLVIVSGAFVYAGLLKAIDPKAFLSSILTYEILPYNWAVASSLFVPYLELIVGVALLIPRYRNAGAWLIGLLMLLFLGFIAQAYARGLSIECGCFGPSEVSDNTGYVWLFIRDLGLLACLGGFLLLDRRHSGGRSLAK